MATKLLTQYGFSKDKVNVLLGGWNKWKELSTANPAAYPIDTKPGGGVQPGGVGITVQPAISTPGGAAPGGTTPNVVNVPTTAP